MSAISDVREGIGLNLEEEIRALPKERRQKLLKDSLPVQIQLPVDHSLAMKSNLSISWSKLRKLRR